MKMNFKYLSTLIATRVQADTLTDVAIKIQDQDRHRNSKE